MKKIGCVMFIVSLLFVSCASQRIIPKSETTYQRIIELPDMSKDEIFEVTMKNLAYAFVSSKTAIQYQAPDKSLIIVKGNVDVEYSFKPVKTFFTLTIDIKDGRERWTFADMELDTGWPFNLQGQLDSFTEEVNTIIDSIEAAMKGDSGNW